MAISKISVGEFLSLGDEVPVLDVRSPSEFGHAHIPGAFSFPIFDDEERKIIGTAYKQESRETAVKIGVEAFGKKMLSFIAMAEKLLSENGSPREFRVHCWRGGMRSGAMAWLLDLYGFKIHLLAGGYKAYRNHVLSQFEWNYPVHIVGGYTGGNKTGIINELGKLGKAVIDLEELAVHKGSAFGNLDNIAQPSQEYFENILGQHLMDPMIRQADILWLEGESQRLGNVNIPMPFFKQMRHSVVFFMDIPFDARLKHITEIYGQYDPEKLVNATLRIQKKLGGPETRAAIENINAGRVGEAFAILLKYYDRLYLKSTLSTKEGEREIIYVKCDSTDARLNSKTLLDYAAEYQRNKTD